MYLLRVAENPVRTVKRQYKRVCWQTYWSQAEVLGSTKHKGYSMCHILRQL